MTADVVCVCECRSFYCVVMVFAECLLHVIFVVFFFQAEDGIRDLVRSRGLGDVYKRQTPAGPSARSGFCNCWARKVVVAISSLEMYSCWELSLIHI